MASLEFISPRAYFQELVSDACQNTRKVLNEDIEFYLVNLLCEYIDPPDFSFFDTPLALKLKEALESNHAEQFKLLKGLGDISLYLAGYFRDFLERKPTDLTYYVSMGKNAYYTISRNQTDKCFARIYNDLGSNFNNLVEIVAAISDHHSSINQDLIRVYEKWVQTGSKTLEKRLEVEGVITSDPCKESL